MTRTLLCIVLALPLYLQASVEEILISKQLPIQPKYLNNYEVKSTKWTRTSTNLYNKYLVGSAIDYHQSKRLQKCINLNTCNIYESNPLYGKYPDRQKILLGKMFAGWYIKDSLNEMENHHRIRSLRILNAIQWSVVLHNEHLFNTKRDKTRVSLEFKYTLFD